MVKTITVKEALKRSSVQFIDTRTPKEFTEDHIPNAINIPLLSNEERAVVGTLYKQVSREKAIEQGIEFFSKRMPDFMKQIDQFKNKELIIYCWRGGMRSRTVTALLESLRYPVFQLEGGYKSFRKIIKEELYTYVPHSRLIVLHGLTCTGKTDLLKHFSNSLDLEQLAQHRSSLYGSIGLTPHSQKRFETLLWQRLYELKEQKWIFIEGESRRIGDCIIPESLWRAMNKGVHILITRTMENRTKAAIEEYCNTAEKIAAGKKITEQLSKVISKQKKEEMITALHQNDLERAMQILLEYYYDPLYSHSLKEIKFKETIENNVTTQAVEKLQQLIQPLE